MRTNRIEIGEDAVEGTIPCPGRRLMSGPVDPYRWFCGR